MTKNKRHLITLTIGAAAVFFLWKYLHRNTPQNNAGNAGNSYGGFSGSPYNSTVQYGPSGSPFAFNPTNQYFQLAPNPNNINVTIAPFNSLTNKYIPLYGFVGMAAS